MFPKKVKSRNSELKSGELVKKYKATIDFVRSIEEKMDSQETLIQKLNRMNS